MLRWLDVESTVIYIDIIQLIIGSHGENGLNAQ